MESGGIRGASRRPWARWTARRFGLKKIQNLTNFFASRVCSDQSDHDGTKKVRAFLPFHLVCLVSALASWIVGRLDAGRRAVGRPACLAPQHDPYRSDLHAWTCCSDYSDHAPTKLALGWLPFTLLSRIWSATSEAIGGASGVRRSIGTRHFDGFEKDSKMIPFSSFQRCLSLLRPWWNQNGSWLHAIPLAFC